MTFLNGSVKQRALATVSTSAVLMAFSTVAAQAQTPAAQTAQAAPVEEIVVTGTRVQRDGYEAPTPLTVVGIEQIEAAAPANIAEFVNTMPQISGSATPQTSNSSISSGTAGLNTLNLRNLGSTRTLVLLDGQRSVSSTLDNNVDVNTFPQQLVSRVDVVTGGASAAYGSDALSGVVNFILDKKFTGFKGEVSGGVTTYGDDRSWKVALASGVNLGSRGHMLLSGEWSVKDGVFGNNRPWNNTGTYMVVNPSYGTGAGQSTSVPQWLVVSGAQPSNATRGGIITSTALRGIAFGAGGTPYQFNYGSITLDPWTVGGNWQANQFNNEGTLDGAEKRQGIFTRFAYDVTDDVNLYVQASWNNSRVSQNSAPAYQLGNLTIKADNAFLPAEVAAQAAALKITQFAMGKFLSDLPTRGTTNTRRTMRLVVGGEGRVTAFDTDWKWNAYYQKGVTLASETLPRITNNASLAFAIDAVRNANGTIVCRSAQAQAAGCAPLNIFGTGVASQAAINYVIGTPHRNEDFKEDVQAISVTGEPFSSWAGPVSLATGVEHRREGVNGYVDPAYNSGWNVGNYLVTTGHYDVTEGFVETVIPLAKDQVWAKALDLNAAVRATGYSTSGYVTTWKVGATWSLIDDIRVRATRSRDIRAPNLQELFQNGASNTNTVQDRTQPGNPVTTYVGFTVGNPNLVPEKADTTGLGVVLQPQFFPGFQASFDYYNIDIDGTIDTVSAQNIVDLCAAGRQEYCAALTRGPVSGGAIGFSRILIQPFNFVTKTSRGYDIETSYRTRLDNISADWNGEISLRFLATHFLKNYTNTGLVPPTDTVGTVGATALPAWRYNFQISYTNDPMSLSLTGRGFSGGTYNNSYVQCTSGCPVSTSFAPTVSNNYMSGALYWDANISYKIAMGDAGESQVFLTVRNLTNKDAEIYPQGPAGTGFLTQATNPSLYDQLGRTFRAGIRFKM